MASASVELKYETLTPCQCHNYELNDFKCGGYVPKLINPAIFGSDPISGSDSRSDGAAINGSDFSIPSHTYSPNLFTNFEARIITQKTRTGARTCLLSKCFFSKISLVCESSPQTAKLSPNNFHIYATFTAPVTLLFLATRTARSLLTDFHSQQLKTRNLTQETVVS